MQVTFGKKTFIKSKHTSLEGKTIVTFVSEDDEMRGTATATDFEFHIHFKGEEHKDLADNATAIGKLVDAVYKEHAQMRNGVRDKLMGRSV